MPAERRRPCPNQSPRGAGQKRKTASSKGSKSDSATTAANGSGSTSSAKRAGATSGGRRSVELATAPVSAAIELDGWRCEDFTLRTGHAIGRSAQRGDLQLCLTAGETDGSEPAEIPAAVLRWLMTGELPARPPEPDKRQVPFPFAAEESA